MWRVCETVTATNRSRNHKAGEKYDKDVTMDSDVYIRMMCDYMLPQIVTQMPWLKTDKTHLYVQHDGARPHTSAATTQALAQVCENIKSTHGISIQVVQQPPKQPRS